MNNLGLNLFLDRNARLVFLSQLISTVCDKMMSIGLVWYLTTKFSINIVPWFLAISFLPHIFMSFFSSKIINKIGVLKIVIQTEWLRGLILFIFFLLLQFFNLEGNVFLFFLFTSVFLVGIGSSLFNPAILSLPPQIVSEEKVASVNALLDSSFAVSNILGAACSIFFLNYFELKYLVLFNALSFFLAAIFQSAVKVLKTPSDSESEFIDHSITPKSVLKKYPTIKKMLMSFLFINVVFTPILVMIPWYVENVYKGTGRDLAMIEGAMGLGAFLIGLFLSLSGFAVSEKKRMSAVALICFLFGLFFIGFSYTSSTLSAVIVLFFIGILSTFLNVQVLTYFQMSLAEKEVPAIMVAVNIISTASMPLSFAISGLLFPIVNIPQMALVCGLLTVFCSLVMPFYLSEK